MNKICYIGAMALWMLLLTGCQYNQMITDSLHNMEVYEKDTKGKEDVFNGMRNVEERDYATLLLVEPGEQGKSYHFILGIAKEKRVGEASEKEIKTEWACNNFYELSEQYRNTKGKELSLSHLKAVLISVEEMDVLEPFLNGLLQMLEEDQGIAKTCPVLKVEDSKDFISYWDEQKAPVGRYIENLIVTREKHGESIPWIKDYIKSIREGYAVPVWALKKESEGLNLKEEK